jgi:hypothetical protein
MRVRFTPPAALLSLLVLLLLLSGCLSLSVEKPEGFAEISPFPSYRAISPEGLRYSVRTVKNYPPQDLGFWGRALKNHLQAEGYVLIRPGEGFEAANREGLLFEWGLPYRNQSYIYLTAIMLWEQDIVIAEAAGEKDLYARYREAILASLRSLNPQ